MLTENFSISSVRSLRLCFQLLDYFEIISLAKLRTLAATGRIAYTTASQTSSSLAPHFRARARWSLAPCSCPMARLTANFMNSAVLGSNDPSLYSILKNSICLVIAVSPSYQLVNNIDPLLNDSGSNASPLRVNWRSTGVGLRIVCITSQAFSALAPTIAALSHVSL